MTRYINTDNIHITATTMADEMGEIFVSLTDVRKCIDQTPTADVVEVRHGTWYHGTDNGAVYAKCSACGRKMNYSCYGYAYCALCGAKMDGERKEK